MRATINRPGGRRSWWPEFLAWWYNATVTLRLVAVNLAVFVAVTIAGFITQWSGLGAQAAFQWVEMPSLPLVLLTRPWTALTYMVTHTNFLHIIFNLVWLYWIGGLFERMYGGQRLFRLYLYGGLVAAAVFFAAMNLTGQTSWLVGASASVLAILAATAMMLPNQTFLMLLFGPIKLKWIALVAIVMYVGVQATTDGVIALAHLSGVLTGLGYAVWMRSPQRHSVKKGFGKWRIVWGTGKGRKADEPKTQSTNASKPGFSAQDQAELDAILDKIKRTGYAGLTADEKRRLFDVSRKI